jgi:two-component system response regulator PilR (NtrC family)
MNTVKHILVIDDEPDIRELLEITLSRMGLNCTCARNTKEAIEILNKKTFQLCLTDMNLGDGTGIDVIEHIQKKLPDLPVAMITAYGNTETAIAAMKAGAFDYVSKPIDLKKLRSLINSALKLEDLQEPSITHQPTQLLGSSTALIDLREKISKLAKSLAPVFINGESGSGKEVVARMIHQQGPRTSKPFIAVNCGAIPSELMESEFFGHEKGSFTGATEKKEGLFKAAEEGTLFLDEVADLPKDMQVKLLRAIQEKSIRPVGSNQEVSVDVRILSATHKDLAKEVESGSFRQDLFYRINVIELKVPSLRERPDDIETLCTHFLDKLSTRYDHEKPTLSNAALKKLSSYSFPGNVRELENILERAFTLSNTNIIKPDDIILSEIDTQNNDKKLGYTSNIDITQAIGQFESFMESIEKEVLEYALEQTRWNKTAAAELLGISFRTMRYKLQKLNIE